MGEKPNSQTTKEERKKPVVDPGRGIHLTGGGERKKKRERTTWEREGACSGYAAVVYEHLSMHYWKSCSSLKNNKSAFILRVKCSVRLI